MPGNRLLCKSQNLLLVFPRSSNFPFLFFFRFIQYPFHFTLLFPRLPPVNQNPCSLHTFILQHAVLFLLDSTMSVGSYISILSPVTLNFTDTKEQFYIFVIKNDDRTQISLEYVRPKIDFYKYTNIFRKILYIL